MNMFCNFQTILGQTIHRPAKLDKKLARELKALASADDPYDTIIGKTLCTNDFYEGSLDFYAKTITFYFMGFFF